VAGFESSPQDFGQSFVPSILFEGSLRHFPGFDFAISDLGRLKRR